LGLQKKMMSVRLVCANTEAAPGGMDTEHPCQNACDHLRTCISVKVVYASRCKQMHNAVKLLYCVM
jgi:hypothetical protein